MTESFGFHNMLPNVLNLAPVLIIWLSFGSATSCLAKCTVLFQPNVHDMLQVTHMCKGGGLLTPDIGLEGGVRFVLIFCDLAKFVYILAR